MSNALRAKHVACQHTYQFHSFNKTYNVTVPATTTSATVIWPGSSAQSLTKPWRACRKKTQRELKGGSAGFRWVQVLSGCYPLPALRRGSHPNWSAKHWQSTSFTLIRRQVWSYCCVADVLQVFSGEMISVGVSIYCSYHAWPLGVTTSSPYNSLMSHQKTTHSGLRGLAVKSTCV